MSCSVSHPRSRTSPVLRTAFGASLLALAATGALAAPVPFTCKDGTSLVATFAVPKSGPGSVTLVFGNGERLDLPQVISADGGRYEAGKVEFWTKGRGARLTRPSGATECTVTRQ